MPPPRRRPTREETRTRLLEAAGEVFAEHGFASASLDDVARQAGLTKGAVYSNFGSKDELILGLMEDRIGRRATAAVESLASVAQASHGRLVEALGEALTEATRADEQWQRLFLAFWLRAMREPPVREQLVARRRAQRAELAALIAAAAQERAIELAVTPEDVAVAVLAVSNGIAIEMLLDPRAVAPDLFGRLLGGLVKR